MVGGIVEAVVVQVHNIRVLVFDKQPSGSLDWSCVHLNPLPAGWPSIMPGDALWWQGAMAYWTPLDQAKFCQCSGRHQDIPLPKMGYSFTPEPLARWRKRAD